MACGSQCYHRVLRGKDGHAGNHSPGSLRKSGQEPETDGVRICLRSAISDLRWFLFSLRFGMHIAFLSSISRVITHVSRQVSVAQNHGPVLAFPCMSYNTASNILRLYKSILNWRLGYARGFGSGNVERMVPILIQMLQ